MHAGFLASGIQKTGHDNLQFFFSELINDSFELSQEPDDIRSDYVRDSWFDIPTQ